MVGLCLKGKNIGTDKVSLFLAAEVNLFLGTAAVVGEAGADGAAVVGDAGSGGAAVVVVVGGVLTKIFCIGGVSDTVFVSTDGAAGSVHIVGLCLKGKTFVLMKLVGPRGRVDVD